MAELPQDLEQAELKKRAMRRLAVAIALVAAAVAVLVLLGRDKPSKPAVLEKATPEIAPPFIIPPPADVPPPAEPPPQPVAALEAEPQTPPAAQPSPAPLPATKSPAVTPPPPEVVSKALPKPGTGPTSTMATPPATRSTPAATTATATAAPAEKPPVSSKPAEAPSAKGYAVQLGVFTNYANARQLQERLAQNGIKSYTETRVHVGPFRDKAEAEQAYAKIKALGISAVVVAH